MMLETGNSQPERETKETVITSKGKIAFVCAPYCDDPTVQQEKKYQEWPTRSTLPKHQRSTYHTKSFQWIRQLKIAQGGREQEWTCFYLGCPNLDAHGEPYEWASWDGVANHVIAASQSMASDQHGRAIRDAGWLEDEFFLLDKPAELIAHQKEYRSKERAKQKAAKEADEGPSAKWLREEFEKDFYGEQMQEKHVLKQTPDGMPLIFAGPNPPPTNISPLQPPGGMTREEWVVQHNQQLSYGLTFEEWRAQEMANPNSLVKFGP
jgi:hypothetical protein